MRHVAVVALGVVLLEDDVHRVADVAAQSRVRRLELGLAHLGGAHLGLLPLEQRPHLRIRLGNRARLRALGGEPRVQLLGALCRSSKDDCANEDVSKKENEVSVRGTYGRSILEALAVLSLDPAPAQSVELRGNHKGLGGLPYLLSVAYHLPSSCLTSLITTFSPTLKLSVWHPLGARVGCL